MTITVGHPVSYGEAFALLDAALLMRGFAILESGGVHKILPVTEAGSGAPFRKEDAPTAAKDSGASFLTTLFRLRVADAETVAEMLQHLVAQNRSALPYPPTNSLILVGTEPEVRRLISLAGALDSGVADEVLLRTLRYREADIVSELALEISKPSAGQDALDFFSDGRTNTVIAVGSPEQLTDARKLLEQLDVPLASGGPIAVIRLLRRDAEELAEILHALGAGGGTKSSRATVAGVATPLLEGDVLSGREFTVVAEPATNSLLVDADPKTFALLRDVIEALDQEQPQVLVEVMVLEISHPTTLALGVDWFLPVLDGQSGNTIGTLTSNPTGGGFRGVAGEDTSFFGRISKAPLIVPFVDSSGIPVDVVVPQETAVITADSREIDTRVLTRPRLVMAPGEEHELFAGQNIPVPVASPDAADIGSLAGTQTRVQIERQDVGIILRVQPTLGQVGKVQLKLEIEISRVGEAIAGSVELVGPSLDKREVTTDIALGDGELAIIGTSQQRQVNKGERGIPFIRDIPLLGYLARSGRTETEDVHLVFSVQARILRTSVDLLGQSIRQRLAFARSLERVRGLEPTPGAPYALLLDTFESAGEAETLAERLEAMGGTAQISRFDDSEGELHDVYLTGYSELTAAGEAARRLWDLGYQPQVVVLPSEPALAVSPEFTPFSNYPLQP